MRLIKKVLIFFVGAVFIGQLVICILYFIKFNNGLSSKPEHWYSASSVIINLLTLLVTIIIAIYVWEATKQSSRFSEQRKIYVKLLDLMKLTHERIQKDDFVIDYMTKLENSISEFTSFKNESYLFNDPEIYGKGIEEYCSKLNKIYETVYDTLSENNILSKYSMEDLKRVRILNIDRKMFYSLNINKEEQTLRNSIIKAMK